MKRYGMLIIGILCLIVSLVWMIVSEASTGPFLLLGAASGALIAEGIRKLKNKR